MQISIPILYEGLSQIDVTQNMCAGGQFSRWKKTQ